MPPVRSAPVLRTERLVLEAHRTDDLADCTAMWSDPQVVRYVGGTPAGAEEVWARMLRYAGLWAVLGYGFWAVREKDTGRFVGEVGLADFRRDLTPPLGPVPEVGWALAPWAHGQGLATEAVRAALGWGDEALEAPATACLIDPHNAASIRVAEKCGFRLRTEALYRGHATLVFGRMPSRGD
ncbi:MAG: GNAT family N-acetyltransferase [Caulobacteraceae bacterium]|nr:GNAT family N-acetyltransferase [Caulobacteraceae bacterium]